MKGNLKDAVLEHGDRLVLACRPSTIMRAREIEGVDFISDRGLDLEQIAAHQGSIVEGVIGPLSSIAGKTIEELNFRQRFRMVILAIHRHGRNVREQMGALNLQFGDTLLMMGTDRAIENLRKTDDIILLDLPSLPAENLQKKKPFVIGVLLAVIVAASMGVSFLTASLSGVAILLVTGCLKPKEAYQSIEWSILFLIFGMLALGQAMESTGITKHITNLLQTIAESLPGDYRAYIMLLLIYIVTNITTEMLTNNAVAILMAPVGILLAETMGIDPRPFVIAICVAASASFSTPIGYQTNTYVYSVGGYRFRDFPRIGIPLNIMCAIVAMLVIPYFWPFTPLA